jgi:hypothetical protein
MAAILFVRIDSGLDVDEFERRLIERRPLFREVPGLAQKIYGRDERTGDVCGIYLFESMEALAAFRETELARTIPTAYEAVDVRREVYEVLYPLWPERGPFAERHPMPDASRGEALAKGLPRRLQRSAEGGAQAVKGRLGESRIGSKPPVEGSNTTGDADEQDETRHSKKGAREHRRSRVAPKDPCPGRRRTRRISTEALGS